MRDVLTLIFRRNDPVAPARGRGRRTGTHRRLSACAVIRSQAAGHRPPVPARYGRYYNQESHYNNESVYIVRAAVKGT